MWNFSFRTPHSEFPVCQSRRQDSHLHPLVYETSAFCSATSACVCHCSAKESNLVSRFRRPRCDRHTRRAEEFSICDLRFLIELHRQSKIKNRKSKMFKALPRNRTPFRCLQDSHVSHHTRRANESRAARREVRIESSDRHPLFSSRLSALVSQLFQCLAWELNPVRRIKSPLCQP